MRAGAPERLEALIRLALEEDVGTGDATTAATVPAGRRGQARIVAKAEGVVAGTAVIARVYVMLTGEAEVSIHAADGARVAPGDVLARIDAPFAALLTGERVVMNFLCHLSGIATRTRRFVDALEGTGAVVVDTRKTIPGLRDLEKAAVRAGGGTNHRFGLDDALLIKENHVTAAGGLTAAVHAAGRAAGERPVQVEVRSQEELSEALDAGARFLLLDNVTPEAARPMIASARRRHPDVVIEVSGGLDESNALAFARAGADRLSIGALTHSAPVLDLSMLIEAR